MAWSRETKNVVGKDKAFMYFLDKSGFIPLDTKESSRTYLGTPTNWRELMVSISHESSSAAFLPKWCSWGSSHDRSLKSALVVEYY